MRWQVFNKSRVNKTYNQEMLVIFHKRDWHKNYLEKRVINTAYVWSIKFPQLYTSSVTYHLESNWQHMTVRQFVTPTSSICVWGSVIQMENGFHKQEADKLLWREKLKRNFITVKETSLKSIPEMSAETMKMVKLTLSFIQSHQCSTILETVHLWKVKSILMKLSPLLSRTSQLEPKRKNERDFEKYLWYHDSNTFLLIILLSFSFYFLLFIYFLGTLLIWKLFVRHFFIPLRIIFSY